MIEVVRMGLEHIDAVMVVENLSFKIPWSKNAFAEEIANNKFAHYLAALSDGQVVGYAGLWKVFDEGHITNIAVHPEFRGNGIGAALVAALVDLAQREEILRMTLEVRKGNHVAQNLYRKFGFTVEGVRKAYYADNGEDAVIMWKNEIP